ncbi:Tpo5 protein [Saccharomycopsis crataegensis]|uniref:Tpo5 protein n=1 Tax=Saccharomycopsis crataegensis TaxID=43959 RepID=A0AAV5QQV3_9ASCO|nr:Tpo5 protein [Saccharomycopsis crataegensis]
MQNILSSQSIASSTLQARALLENVQNAIHNLEDSDAENEVEEIEHFKYKQELSRKLTLQSVLGLSVSIMSVPLGQSTTMIVPLLNGGAGTLFWGWIVVCILSLLVTTSLGEISGKYPTNGGVYHWSFIFSPRSIKKITNFNYLTSWYVGWFLIVGNLTMGVSIMFSGAQFFLSIFGIADTTYHPHAWLTLVVYILLVAICLFVNMKCYNFLDKINRVAVYWTVSTVLIIDILLLLFSQEFNDLKEMLINFETPRSGWPRSLAFLIGLQQSAFTFQGYGMIPSMTDEVKDPEKTIPKGMVLSILVAGATGIIFILPILACTPQLDVLLDVEANILPIELIFKVSSQSILISFLFVILLCGTIFFGSIGIYTITSRSIYSMARDNGLPYSHLWNHIGADPNLNKIPNNAIYLTAGWLLLMGSFTLLSPSILYSFMGTSVVSLAISNGVPIFFSMVNGRKKLKGGAFKVKKIFGYLINSISIFWCLLMLVIFSFPIEAHFTTYTMNYTSFTLFVEIVAITVLWFSFGKNHFQGPEIDESFNIESNNRGATYLRLSNINDNDDNDNDNHNSDDDDYD